MIAPGLVALVLLVAAGLGVLSLAPARLRPLLVPALPAMGAGALVVALHFTTLAWPTQVITPFMCAALAVIVPVSLWRLRRLPLVSVGVGVAALLMGLSLGAFALLPALRSPQQTVVSAGVGTDSRAFVTLTDWFERHRITDYPRFAIDSPAYGYVLQHQKLHARIGQDLVQGLIASTVRRDPLRTWYPVTCVWLAIIPGAFTSAALALLRNRQAAFGAGVAAGGVAIVVGQVFNQNSASLLGMALAPLALAAFVSRLEATAEGAWPLWLVGASTAALLGAYSEYTTVLVPALAFVVVARRLSEWPRVAREVLAMGGVTVVAGPVECWRGARSLLDNLQGHFFPRVATPFSGVGPWQFVNRVIGASSRIATSSGFRGGASPAPSTYLVLATVTVGVVAVLAWGAARRVWLGVMVATIASIEYLTVVHPFPYGAQRAIEIAAPLMVLTIAAGLEALPPRFGRRPRSWVAGGVVVTLAAGSLAVNLDTSASVAFSHPGPAHTVTADFAAGARWLSTSDPSGRNAIVIDSDEFDEVWLAYAARRLSRIAYAYMPSASSGGPPLGLWDGSVRRFAVIGAGEYLSSSALVLVQNARFRLVDLGRPDTLIGSPTAAAFGAEHGPRGMFHWFTDKGQVALVGTCTSARAVVRIQTLPALNPLPVDVAVGAATVHVTLTTATSNVMVPLRARGATIVTLRNRRGATTSTTDPRALAVRVLSIDCAGRA